MKNNKVKTVIIAGEGSLPIQVHEECLHKKIPHMIICIEDHAKAADFADTENTTLPMHAVGKILTAITEYDAKHVVLAGKVRRIKLSKLLLDLKGAKLFSKIMRGGVNDDALLRTIIQFLEDEGLKVIPADQIVKDMFVDKGSETKTSPSNAEIEEIQKGKKVLRDISKHDMGQALVIQAGLVLGVEAVEGTDELINRCGSIKQKIKEKPILIKMMKVDQDAKADVPCIGVNTIQNLYDAGMAGVAVEAKKTYILDRAETVKLANKLKVFIYGF